MPLPLPSRIRAHETPSGLMGPAGGSVTVLPPYGPINSTQSGSDELIAHLLIFASRYDRVVAGRLGGRYEARGRHR
jgi:hypothetical protein